MTSKFPNGSNILALFQLEKMSKVKIRPLRISLPRLKGVRDSSEKSGAERRSPVVSENEFMIFDLSLVSTKAALQWSDLGAQS